MGDNTEHFSVKTIEQAFTDHLRAQLLPKHMLDGEWRLFLARLRQVRRKQKHAREELARQLKLSPEAAWKCPYCGHGEWKNRSDWEQRFADHVDQCPEKPKEPDLTNPVE